MRKLYDQLQINLKMIQGISCQVDKIHKTYIRKWHTKEKPIKLSRADTNESRRNGDHKLETINVR